MGPDNSGEKRGCGSADVSAESAFHGVESWQLQRSADDDGHSKGSQLPWDADSAG